MFALNMMFQMAAAALAICIGPIRQFCAALPGSADNSQARRPCNIIRMYTSVLFWQDL